MRRESINVRLSAGPPGDSRPKPSGRGGGLADPTGGATGDRINATSDSGLGPA
jgi:hypothetical protein